MRGKLSSPRGLPTSIPVLQAGTATRETVWIVGHVGEAAFYYLSAVAILPFLYGIYERVARYADAPTNPLSRLDDIAGRVARATRLLLTNEAQLDRDADAGVIHTFVVWGFLVLLLGTTILAVDMEIWTLPFGRDSFFVGDFYLSYSLILDAFGLLFVVGVGMALRRRYLVRDPRLWGKTHRPGGRRLRPYSLCPRRRRLRRRGTAHPRDWQPRLRDGEFRRLRPRPRGPGGRASPPGVAEDVKPSEERLREAVEDGRKTGSYEAELEILDLTELLVTAMGTAPG